MHDSVCVCVCLHVYQFIYRQTDGSADRQIDNSKSQKPPYVMPECRKGSKRAEEGKKIIKEVNIIHFLPFSPSSLAVAVTVASGFQRLIFAIFHSFFSLSLHMRKMNNKRNDNNNRCCDISLPSRGCNKKAGKE